MDETQLQNSVEYDFNDELMKPVDLTDEYDEIVPNLPKYEVWKNGKNIGFTRVSIRNSDRTEMMLTRVWDPAQGQPGRYGISKDLNG